MEYPPWGGFGSSGHLCHTGNPGVNNQPHPALLRWKQEWESRCGDERTLRVRWMLSPDDEPLSNVQLAEQNGRVVDIRTCAETDRTDSLPLVLIPPLVNAHTHLEFSALREPLQPAQPFPDWIRSVINWRQSSGDSPEDAIRGGLGESRNAGVRLIGEIATHHLDALYGDQDVTTVLFREIIGLRPDRIQQQLEQAAIHLSAEHREGIIRAISPHAPYSVHPDLLEEVVSLAVQHQVPVAMHLAETPDELELLATGRGRFKQFLSGLGLFDQAVFPGDRTVLKILQQLARAPRALAIHGNYFSDSDAEFLAGQLNITTVYCPRTHEFFGHMPHPFRKLIAAGCRVVLGTDSRASNPDLNIWRELQHVARIAPELSPGRLLAMVTTHSAEAMGLAVEPYQIRVGTPLRPVFLSFEKSLTSMKEIFTHPATCLFHP